MEYSNLRYASDVSLEELRSVAIYAHAAGLLAEPGRVASGCGRVYVELGKIRKGSKVAKVLESVGFKMFPRPYHSGLRIYVGYENCDGLALNMADAIAEKFRELGISAYADADGD